MSVRVMSLVWQCDLPTSEKMVLLILADHCDDQGRNAWPSVATIAQKASIKERQVQRLLQSLMDRSLVSCEKQAGGTRDWRNDRRPNRYTINLDGVSSMSSREDGVSSKTERGVMGDADGVSSSTPKPSREPSIELSSFPEASPTGVKPEQPTAANLVTAAFVDAFTHANGDKPPKQSISRIAQGAKQLLTEGKTLESLIAAAENAGTAGHANLAASWMYLNARQTPLNGPRIDAESEDAWQTVLDAIGRHGRYNRPDFPTEKLTTTVLRIGWQNLCNATDLPKLKRQFLDVWRQV